MQVHITTNAATVARQVGEFPAVMLRAIAKALDAENQIVIGNVNMRRLNFPRSGPATMEGLRHITGRLAKSIAASKAKVDGPAVVSAIGSNVEYARIHEEGFTGAVMVPAHQRRITVGRKTAVAVRVNKAGQFVRDRKTRATTGTGNVRAHSRDVSFPARRYIGREVEANASNYVAAVSSSIVTAWERISTAAAKSQ